ncbi:MAG: 50S ribosomal protein L3 [Nitrospinaceae bacterium]|nr:50S ribosomal protein L3 [Nitrospinaceae bacterium]
MDFIMGRKLGMTHVFSPDGGTIPVTVVEAGPCTVLQKKSIEKDGYEALQIGFAQKKEKGVSKAMMGHFKKAGSQPFRYIREVPIGEGDEELEVGSVIDATAFDRGDRIDVTGTSKGRGFAGAMKRHGFSGGPASHGGMFDRGIGSVGNAAYPGRIIKGKKMAGHMGNERVTTQCVLLVDLVPEDNLIFVRGSVPGAPGGLVFLRKSVKGQRGGLDGPKEQVRSLNPLKASKRAARGG